MLTNKLVPCSQLLGSALQISRLRLRCWKSKLPASSITDPDCLFSRRTSRNPDPFSLLQLWRPRYQIKASRSLFGRTEQQGRPRLWFICWICASKSTAGLGWIWSWIAVSLWNDPQLMPCTLCYESLLILSLDSRSIIPAAQIWNMISHHIVLSFRLEATTSWRILHYATEILWID